MLGRDAAVVNRNPRLVAKRHTFLQHGLQPPRATCCPLASTEEGFILYCMELNWATDGTLGVVRENS
jgi:hypothetical protein